MLKQWQYPIVGLTFILWGIYLIKDMQRNPYSTSLKVLNWKTKWNGIALIIAGICFILRAVYVAFY